MRAPAAVEDVDVVHVPTVRGDDGALLGGDVCARLHTPQTRI